MPNRFLIMEELELVIIQIRYLFEIFIKILLNQLINCIPNRSTVIHLITFMFINVQK